MTDTDELAEANQNFRARIAGMEVQCDEYTDGSARFCVDAAPQQGKFLGESGLLVTFDLETNEVIGIEVEDFEPFANRQGPDFKRRFELAFEDSPEGNEVAERDIHYSRLTRHSGTLSCTNQIVEWLAKSSTPCWNISDNL